MSKWDKLISELYSYSMNIRFEELRKILEAYGYSITSPRGGSSHYTFRKKGRASITIPKHKPIKKIYLEMVKKAVEIEEAIDENSWGIYGYAI